METVQGNFTTSNTTARHTIFNTPSPHFKTAVFEGPLDLLLHLIRINQVDIYDIPIAQITEQYLQYVAVLEEIDLASVGEYVLMAATLIEIKSRMLLPRPPQEAGEEDEGEDPRAELVARLLEYQQYQGVVEAFRTWEEMRKKLFFRTAMEHTDDYILPVPEGEAHVSQLYSALMRLLSEAGLEEQPITAVTPRRRLSLRLKMAEILRHLQRAGEEGLSFEALFDLPCPRYDIVLAFLSLLELLRQGRILAFQENPKAPIRLIIIALEEPNEYE